MHALTSQNGYTVRSAQRGFSLIELMVGMLVSMVCVLAIMAAFTVYEGHKRTTTSANDAMQNGSFSLYEMERQIRSAGSGIINGSNYSLWGCPIQATTAGSVVMPTTGKTLPAPFNNWPTTVRAIPALIYSGGSSPDMIGIIGGNASYQAFNIAVSTTPSATALTVGNNFGIQTNEYLLGPLTNGNCALAQVATVTGTTNVTFSATNSASTGVQTAQYVFDLGYSPIFTVFGVDTGSNTLDSYDLLERSGNVATPIADGIVQIKALYGIHDGSTAGQTSNYIDHWVQPTGTWAYSAINASQTSAYTAAAAIKAIRIAVVAQSRLLEKSTDYTTGSSSLVLFKDLPTTLQYTVTTNPQYRYRVYDTVIPLRNAMIINHF